MPIQITVTGDLHLHVADPDAIVTPILAAIAAAQGETMTALEDLQAADAALDAQVAALVAEQAQFLIDVAAALAAAGTDPAALAAVATDLTNQAAQLQALHDAQVAADPGPPAVA